MSRRWSQTHCVTVLALLAAFVATASLSFGDQLVVLEDQTAAPAVLDTMHSDMITSGFVLVRPLQGRLAGQGYLWAVPATLSVQEATSLVSEMDGCLQAIDAATGTTGTEVLESGAIVYSGKLYIGFDAPDLETNPEAVEQLGALGFVLIWHSSYSPYSRWSFLPLEYSVQEAITEVEAVGGVMYAGADLWIPWICIGDANGSGGVNILDLIFVRNRLNQDVNTGDNWKADVNWDGRINILDLILVRNHMNTICW